MDTRTARALPVLLGLACTWGGSFLFIKYILEDSGPLEVALGRIALGALAVAAYMIVSRRPLKASPGLVARVSVMAVANNIIPFILIPLGEEHISSGTASILNATVPIFTVVFAATALDEEHFTSARIVGLLLAFVGVGVLTGGDVLDVTSSNVLGELAVVGAAASYGVGTVYTRQTLRGQDPVSVSLIQLTLSTVLLGPIVLAFSGGVPDFSLSARGYASLLALGLAGTGMAYIAFFWLIENLGSVRATLVTYIVPIIAVFLGWIALDESIGVNTIAGGLLIVAGVASVMRGQAPVRQPRIEPIRAVAAGK
ncbi:MAG: DMT family transporter [Chloroflexota bacterium]